MKVGRVDAGSPAAAAGLQKGDLIVSINGKNVVQIYERQRRQNCKVSIQGCRSIAFVVIWDISNLLQEYGFYK